DVRVMGRSTQGVRLVNLHENDILVGITRIEHVEAEDAEQKLEEEISVDAEQKLEESVENNDSAE
ncbi:MAG: hypothetical protein HYZ48_04895, partial [Chlamydiales bacterium]|nr:hypothetical protein [Chlamydiales bacterium]